eukprot:39460-Pyramimonas_sp.AAC.1
MLTDRLNPKTNSPHLNAPPGQLQEMKETLEMTIREHESKEALANAARQAEAAKLEVLSAQQELTHWSSPTFPQLPYAQQAQASLPAIAAQKAEAARERLTAIKNSVRHPRDRSGMQSTSSGFTKPMDNALFKANQQAQEQR